MNWTERIDELTAPQRRLVTVMAAQAEMRKANVPVSDRPSDLVYFGMQDFLLQHGQWFEPKPWRFDFRKGADCMCFGNSLVLSVMDGLRYIEGAVLSEHHPFDIHHGWNVDADGRLIDNTWFNTGIAYLGVEFSPQRLDFVSWYEDAAILQNPTNKYQIFREPWTGEDFDRVWKHSPAWRKMQLVKRGFADGPRTMRQKPPANLPEIDIVSLPGKGH